MREFIRINETKIFWCAWGLSLALILETLVPWARGAGNAVLAEDWLGKDQGLLAGAALLGMMCAFAPRRWLDRQSPLLFMGVALLGQALEIVDLVSHGLGGTLSKSGLGQMLMGRPMGSEWVILFISAVGMIVMLARGCWSLFESKVQTWALAVCSAMALSSVAFHTTASIMAMGAFEDYKERMLAARLSADWAVGCQALGAQCVEEKSVEELKAKMPAPLLKKFKGLDNNLRFLPEGEMLGFFVFNPPEPAAWGVAGVFRGKKGFSALWITENWRSTINDYTVVIGRLSLFAHVIWLLGGLLVLRFHLRRKFWPGKVQRDKGLAPRSD